LTFVPNPNSPILIAAPARCGATLVGSILHEHGVWFTDSAVSKMPFRAGYFGLDNRVVDEVLKEYKKASYAPSAAHTIIKHVPPYGRWGIKSGQVLIKNPLLQAAFPGAWWVFPYRPVESIAASAMYHPLLARDGYETRLEWARKHQKMQTGLAKAVGSNGIQIDMDKIGPGDRTEAEKLVTFCGLDFDESAWAKVVDPQKWYKGGS